MQLTSSTLSRARRGVFDTMEAAKERFLLPGDVKGLKFATWNSNGLMATDAKKHMKKLQYAKKLAHDNDIPMLQETHGSVLRWNRLQDDLRTTHVVRFSVIEKEQAGGSATLVKRALWDMAVEEPTFTILEAGRVTSLCLKMGVGIIWANNVHNEQLKHEQTVVQKLGDTVREARSDVTTRSISVVAGDFNFPAACELPHRLGIKGAAVPDIKNKWHNITRLRRWAPLLNDCVELLQEEPTRLGKAQNGADDYYWIASRLDRVYTSWAPWQFTLANASTGSRHPVTEMEKIAGSDHAAVCVRL